MRPFGGVEHDTKEIMRDAIEKGLVSVTEPARRPGRRRLFHKITVNYRTGHTASMADKKEEAKARYEKAVQNMMKRYDMERWAAELHLAHWD